MKKEDHLSNEISVSAELVDNSVKASAKSRALSGIDRLVGSSVDFFSAQIEALTEKRREKTQGEVAIIRKAAEFGIQEMHTDHDFAKRAFETHYKGILREQENREAVVVNALEDLRSDPMSEDAMSAGPEELSEEFLGRFEEYAKSASTEELRERWGKILSGEIRKPGTFSRKVLRAIDELEPNIAALFEEVSKFCIQGAMFRSIARDLAYTERVDLFTAGLITGVDENQVRYFFEVSLNDGTIVWFLALGNFAIAYPKDAVVDYANSKILSQDDNKPYLRTNLLSDVGNALLSIIQRDEQLIARSIANVVSSQLPAGTLMHFKLDAQSKQWLNIPAI
ncbi:DUF2806 domain-containing protein [Brucella intermedia]|uniref:DUF2806 domain-containing protein n=1 Tax=Brucella intermedia TaxID=94625 RepID=UPI000EFBE730|nr:DUF2806 domain-containing protein [Brucella intermedia]